MTPVNEWFRHEINFFQRFTKQERIYDALKSKDCFKKDSFNIVENVCMTCLNEIY